MIFHSNVSNDFFVAADFELKKEKTETQLNTKSINIFHLVETTILWRMDQWKNQQKGKNRSSRSLIKASIRINKLCFYGNWIIVLKLVKLSSDVFSEFGLSVNSFNIRLNEEFFKSFFKTAKVLLLKNF